MRFYESQVLPRALNLACGGRMAEPLRRRVRAGLAGEVVEIGFGAEPCTSSSTDWPPTRMCAAGNDASTHCTSAWSGAATSTGPSLTC